MEMTCMIDMIHVLCAREVGGRRGADQELLREEDPRDVRETLGPWGLAEIRQSPGVQADAFQTSLACAFLFGAF